VAVFIADRGQMPDVLTELDLGLLSRVVGKAREQGSRF
jgi:hypothetical protein